VQVKSNLNVKKENYPTLMFSLSIFICLTEQMEETDVSVVVKLDDIYASQINFFSTFFRLFFLSLFLLL
jgi:hypothetical protein